MGLQGLQPEGHSKCHLLTSVPPVARRTSGQNEARPSVVGNTFCVVVVVVVVVVVAAAVAVAVVAAVAAVAVAVVVVVVVVVVVAVVVVVVVFMGTC